MQNVFFTSDSHYQHKNICRGTSEWKEFEEGSSHQSTRDFDTVEQMNDAIVEGINSTVQEDDILYHLGDWSFGGVRSIWEFRKRIKCKNIHIILGNHDHHIENNKLLPNVLWCTKSNMFVDYDTIGKQKTLEGVNAQDLFSSVQHVKTIKVNGIHIFLSHYAHRVWDKSHHGRIHLYGHSHNSLEEVEWGKSMDVGIDAAFRRFGVYTPFSFEEIKDIMSVRDAKIIDHHNKYTN